MYTVFPRIEAQVSISFSEIYAPASKRDQPQIGAGHYLILSWAKPQGAKIITYWPAFAVMAASQGVPAHSVYKN